MAVALTSTSSLSVWVNLAWNVAAAPPLDQVLSPGTECVGRVAPLPYGTKALLEKLFRGRLCPEALLPLPTSAPLGREFGCEDQSGPWVWIPILSVF